MRIQFAFAAFVLVNSAYAHEVSKELVLGSDKRAQYEEKLSEGKCGEKEEVNRHLLQQNWFFDEAKTDHGIIFGQTGFSDYSIVPWTSAAFCVEGNTLVATYYHYEPEFSLNGELVHEQTLMEYRSIPSIRMVVEALTENKLVLTFTDSNEKLVLYR